MAQQVTLLDLVTAVSTYARSDAEVVATVVYLVNSGTAVHLGGNFRGARFPARRHPTISVRPRPLPQRDASDRDQIASRLGSPSEARP